MWVMFTDYPMGFPIRQHERTDRTNSGHCPACPLSDRRTDTDTNLGGVPSVRCPVCLMYLMGEQRNNLEFFQDHEHSEIRPRNYLARYSRTDRQWRITRIGASQTWHAILCAGKDSPSIRPSTSRGLRTSGLRPWRVSGSRVDRVG